MTLEEFIAEITEKMGKPASVSRKLIEDYPDLRIIEFKDYQPHRVRNDSC